MTLFSNVFVGQSIILFGKQIEKKIMKNIGREAIIITGGIMLLLLGLFHMFFPILFDWEDQLKKLNEENDSIVQMMNICTITYLFSMGLILLICRSEIPNSKAGRLLLLSLSLFFAVRFILEFLFPGSSLLLGGALLLLVIIFILPVFNRNASSV